MSDNKKYYYLKLKENFFDSDALVVLESQQDGYLYSNILLKLYLKSLKNEGRLAFSELIPYDTKMLATLTRHQVGTVERALKMFETLGLIEVLDNGVIYMSDIQNFIGKSSSEADRQREYQRRITGEKQKLLDDCKKSNKKSCKKSNIKTTPELEKELEKEIELECVFEIPCKNGMFSVDKEYYNELTHTYPNMDVNASLNKLKAYLLSNPEKQRYKKAEKGQIDWWLSGDDEAGKYRKCSEHYGATYDISEYESTSVIDEEWKDDI